MHAALSLALSTHVPSTLSTTTTPLSRLQPCAHVIYSHRTYVCLGSRQATNPLDAAEALHHLRPHLTPPRCRSPSVTLTCSASDLSHAANACMPPHLWPTRTLPCLSPLRALARFPLVSSDSLRPPRLLRQGTRRRQPPITLDRIPTQAETHPTRKSRPRDFPVATASRLRLGQRTICLSANGTCPPQTT